MSQHTQHIATLHGSVPARKGAAIILAIESQFPGCHFHAGKGYDDNVEVHAPMSADLEILDADLDDETDDELVANGVSTNGRH